MTFMNSFLEKNRHLHLLDACYMYEGQLLKQEKELPETLKMIWVIVEDSIKEEKKKVQELKKKILDCKMFWDYSRVDPEADEYLFLNCVSEKEEPELWPIELSQNKTKIKGEYLYKEVFVRGSAAAGPFTVVNTDKKVFRTKISSLPEIDQGFVKTNGCQVMKWDLDKVKLPKWEEISEERVGHEYPDEEMYNY